MCVCVCRGGMGDMNPMLQSREAGWLLRGSPTTVSPPSPSESPIQMTLRDQGHRRMALPTMLMLSLLA